MLPFSQCLVICILVFCPPGELASMPVPHESSRLCLVSERDEKAPIPPSLTPGLVDKPISALLLGAVLHGIVRQVLGVAFAKGHNTPCPILAVLGGAGADTTADEGLEVADAPGQAPLLAVVADGGAEDLGPEPPAVGGHHDQGPGPGLAAELLDQAAGVLHGALLGRVARHVQAPALVGRDERKGLDLAAGGLELLGRAVDFPSSAAVAGGRDTHREDAPAGAAAARAGEVRRPAAHDAWGVGPAELPEALHLLAPGGGGGRVAKRDVVAAQGLEGVGVARLHHLADAPDPALDVGGAPGADAEKVRRRQGLGGGGEDHGAPRLAGGLRVVRRVLVVRDERVLGLGQGR